MFRSGILALMIVLAGCSNNEGTGARQSENKGQPFAHFFKEMKPPYSLSDSGLNANKDTAQIRSEAWNSLIPDTIAQELFGNKNKIRYTPLAMFEGKKNETYFLAKGAANNRKAALLVVSAAGDSVTSVLTFLKPDNDPSTKQITTMEANYSVVRTTMRKLEDDVFQEGKDVYAYSDIGRTFDLVMTDALDDKEQDLINPIDTLGKTYQHAGDYSKDKRNIVSVRDGRKKGLITVFIHMEKNEGACTGEIKGDAEIVDDKTAVYRTAGDPCILTLRFAKGAVTLEEQEGCGSRRGLECSFNGTFNRKKAAKEQSSKRKRA